MQDSIYQMIFSQEYADFPVHQIHYMFVKLPALWKIQPDYKGGYWILDGEDKKGQIFVNSQNAEYVDYIKWFLENGQLLYLDEYREYWYPYKRRIYLNGSVAYSVYFDMYGQKIYEVNESNGVVTWFKHGRVSKIYPSLNEFEKDLRSKYGYL